METHPKLSKSGTLRKLMPYAVSFMAGIVVVVFALGGYAWENKFVGKTALDFFARALGYDAFLERGTSKTALLRAAPENYFRDIEIPKVVLDIKFEDWDKILAKRAKALAIGGLVQEEGDFVPASIRYADGTTVSSAKVKVRLKGDHLDHLEGKKWSFRVKTRGKDHVWGMRRFSLQAPETRDFQLTPMMLALTESLGMVSVRYAFVDLTINGKHIGIMALEEHPAKELLEASARKESVIIRFSEKYFWQWYGGGTQGPQSFRPFDDYRFAPIDAFQSSSIAKSATLKDNYRVASGLLRAFARGDIPASEAFDAELMGRYLAVVELFGSWHGIRWHNMRFYFNPQTARLEPMPFDMSATLKWSAFVTNNAPIVEAMFDDPKVEGAFRAHLLSLIERTESGEIAKLLRDAESRHLPRLQTEYVFLGPYPVDRLAKRAATLRDRFFENKSAPVKYKRHVFARKYDQGGKRFLSLLNATLHPVVVQRVHLGACAGGTPLRADVVDADVLPLTLPAQKHGERPNSVEIPLMAALDRNCEIRVDTRMASGGETKSVIVDPDAPPLAVSPIPSSTVAGALAGRDFLAYDRAANELRVAAGDHAVGRDLVVPDGVALVIPAGTTLRFAPGAAIVAHGPVRFMGTAAAPVTLRPADDAKGWQGIAVVRAGARSVVRHTRFLRTTGVAKPGWTLTGGVTFYESDVDIAETRFEDHRGEDALNVVRSDFTVDKSAFDTTFSDAFDSDFSTGKVTNSSFTNVGTAGGGDAVDFSGSRVEIRNVRFNKVSDKAISVGEASEVTATDVTIDDTGTGLASKDRSRLTATNVTMRGVKFAPLAAYVKKPEYGGAEIVADNVTVETGKSEALVQLGSRIRLAGNDVAARDIDIDALYDTVMKKAGR